MCLSKIIQKLPFKKKLLFKKNTKQGYKHCVISKAHKSICDVAHIIPRSICKHPCFVCNTPCYMTYINDENNGIFLDKNNHCSFDKYYWCFDVFNIISPTPENPNWCQLPIIINQYNKKINIPINTYFNDTYPIYFPVKVKSLPFLWIRYMMFFTYNFQNTIQTDEEYTLKYHQLMTTPDFYQLKQNPLLILEWANTTTKKIPEFVIHKKPYHNQYLTVFKYLSYSQKEYLSTNDIPTELLQIYTNNNPYTKPY